MTSGTKRILITGANSGIGLTLAKLLLPQNRKLVLSCRSDAQAQDLCRQLAQSGHQQPNALALDLASFASVKASVAALKKQGAILDALVLNAGVHIPWKKLKSSDGLELHYQVNCAAYVLLVLLLRQEKLLAPGALIIYISSEAHRMASLPNWLPLGFWRAYAKSKETANAVFNQARYFWDDLQCIAMSPGSVDTPVHRYKPAWLRALTGLWKRYRSVEQAALEIRERLQDRTSLSPNALPFYWHHGEPRPQSARAESAEFASLLWARLRSDLRPWISPEAALPLVAPLRNHAGTLDRLAPSPHEPRSVAELSELVRDAQRKGLEVRAIGGLHSYNDSPWCKGVIFSLKQLREISAPDRERGTIRVEAGVTVRMLCEALDKAGLTLPFAGNYGEQSAIGAALTGTHGYAREGGLLTELITRIWLVDSTGTVQEFSQPEDLELLRISLGIFGVVVAAEFRAIPQDKQCRYRFRHHPKVAFFQALPVLATTHEHFRYYPNRIDERYIAALSIDISGEYPPGSLRPELQFIDRGAYSKLIAWVFRAFVDAKALAPLRRMISVTNMQQEVLLPFSSFLFINGGVVERNAYLLRSIYQAWNDDSTHNMELALEVEHAEFVDTCFTREREIYTAKDPQFWAYYTARYTGANTSALLAANYGRNVLFFDIHANPASPVAVDFLKSLENALRAAAPVYPHWGKEFFATRAELEGLFPKSTWERLAAMKQRLDPTGTFSNPYSRRVFGV